MMIKMIMMIMNREMMIMMIMMKMMSLMTVHELRRLYLDKDMMIVLMRMTITMMLPCVLS